MIPKKDKHKVSHYKINHKMLMKKMINRKYEMLHRKVGLLHTENKEKKYHRLLIKNYANQNSGISLRNKR